MNSRPENPFEAPKADVRSTGKAGRKDSAGVPAPFQVVCECGRATGVLASQAGSSVSCPCGKTVRVPSLGQLREQAGQDRYETSLSDTIRRKISTGELPSGDTCALMGEPTDSVLELSVLVPPYAWTEGDHNARSVANLLGMNLFGALSALFSTESKFVEEEMELVPTPLRVAPRNHARVLGLSQRRLKRLLSIVPEYEELLRNNFDARVVLPGSEAL